MHLFLADEEASAVVKKERLIEVKNPMKQCTSLKALKRRRTESGSSDDSEEDNTDVVSNAYKSKRCDLE